jgi:hypothetical protein
MGQGDMTDVNSEGFGEAGERTSLVRCLVACLGVCWPGPNWWSSAGLSCSAASCP